MHVTLRPLRRVLATAVTGALALTAAMGSVTAGTAAAATCPPPPTPLQPFLPWDGDQHDYVMTTGGTFATGAPVWTLARGAARMSDQAPDPYASPGSDGALYLPAGSSATSPCVTAPQIAGIVRFYAKQLGASGGGLRVEVLVKGGVYPAATISAGAGWSPTPILPTDAPYYKGAVAYQVRLTAVGGSFAVDDVYFDPYRSR
jgi:hypothetical protein